MYIFKYIYLYYHEDFNLFPYCVCVIVMMRVIYIRNVVYICMYYHKLIMLIDCVAQNMCGIINNKCIFIRDLHVCIIAQLFQ